MANIQFGWMIFGVAEFSYGDFRHVYIASAPRDATLLENEKKNYGTKISCPEWCDYNVTWIQYVSIQPYIRFSIEQASLFLYFHKSMLSWCIHNIHVGLYTDARILHVFCFLLYHVLSEHVVPRQIHYEYISQAMYKAYDDFELRSLNAGYTCDYKYAY